MQTSDRIRVTLDLKRVAQNLRTSDGASASEKTARSFVEQAGFQFDADGSCIGSRAGLRRFNPGEVVGVSAVGD